MAKVLDEVKAYAEKTARNELKTHNKYVVLAVQRFIDDLKRDDIVFREDKVEKIVDFFALVSLIYSTSFILEPWQLFIIANLFGFYLKSDPTVRRFKYSHVEVARKNGKSTFSAAIALYMLLADEEPAPEVYVAATKRDQAKIVWNESKRMLITSQALAPYTKLTQYEIRSEHNFGIFKALASEAKSLDGLNISCCIVDELHEHPNRKLYNVLKSGTGSRKNPLMSTITTAGFNIESFAFEHRKMCIGILEKTIQDDAQFVMIFTLDEDDEWTDKSCWVKANPNLDVSVRESHLDQEFIQAQNNPSERVNFQTKHLNIWTNAETTWVLPEIWDAAVVETDSIDVKNADCYVGLDLAATTDITAIVLLFPIDVDKVFIKVQMWLPEDSVDLHDNYQRWVDDGYLILTPGNVTDYNFIKAYIYEISEIYNIQTIAYDHWNSTQLIVDIEQEIPHVCTPFRQGFQSLSGPTKEFERLAMQQFILHEQNDCLKWMLSNVVLKFDPAGNVKPSREIKKHKIDGIVAAIMALGVYMPTKAKNDDDFEFAIV